MILKNRFNQCISLVTLLAALLGLLGACAMPAESEGLASQAKIAGEAAAPAGESTPDESTETESTETESTETESAASGAPVEITDARGETVIIDDASRIVTLGGPVTEIVFALGAGKPVVAVDTSSSYPPEVRDLPQVGYQRTLSAEGVLALNPTLILATNEAGPPEAIQQLQDAGVDVLVLESEDTVEGVKEKIRGFARALGREAEGEALIARIEAALAEARAYVAESSERPRVMFIYARGAA